MPFEDKSGIIKHPFLVFGSVVTDMGKNMEFNDWRSHIIGTQLFIQPGYRRVFAAVWGEFHLYFSALLLFLHHKPGKLATLLVEEMVVASQLPNHMMTGLALI